MRLIKFLNEDKITKQDLINLEKWADAQWSKVGIDIEFTKHFLERVNDSRNKQQITYTELTDIFRKSLKKYGFKIKNFPDQTEAVLNDINSNINIPFALVWDKKNQEFDLINKTIMRKKNFKTPNTKLKVK